MTSKKPPTATPKTPADFTPEDLFEQALDDMGPTISDGDMRLLLSGLAALREYRLKRLNARELKAVRSLVAYVADRQSVSQETVQAVLSSTFQVAEVRALPSSRYDEVIAFLIDLQIDMALN